MIIYDQYHGARRGSKKLEALQSTSIPRAVVVKNLKDIVKAIALFS